jgi:hypothetical protein
MSAVLLASPGSVAPIDNSPQMDVSTEHLASDTIEK